MKNVWLMNHYAGNTFFDKGGRHYYIAKYLRKSGYRVSVFCSNAMHTEKGYFFDNNDVAVHIRVAKDIDVPFIFVKSRKYEGNGKERLLNIIDFYFNVQKAAKQYAKKYGKPDIIIASSVHPLTLVAGIKLAQYFGVKCICEVRDLWPESIVAYSDRFSENNPLIRLMYGGEKWIYKRADHLIFTMEGAYDYIRHKNWDNSVPRSKVSYVNNGVDTECYITNIKENTFDDKDLNSPDIITINYTGSVRKANGLDYLLDVAKQIDNKRVKFLIWGDGGELESLQNKKNRENISNVIFKGRVEKKFIPYILSKSDINFLDSFNKRVSRYGISSNKLFEYIFAKKPVFMNDIGKYNPLKGCCCVYGGNAYNTAKEIEEILQYSREQKEELSNRMESISKQYSYESLTNRLIDCIELVSTR